MNGESTLKACRNSQRKSLLCLVCRRCRVSGTCGRSTIAHCQPLDLEYLLVRGTSSTQMKRQTQPRLTLNAPLRGLSCVTHVLTIRCKCSDLVNRRANSLPYQSLFITRSAAKSTQILEVQKCCLVLAVATCWENAKAPKIKEHHDALQCKTLETITMALATH